MPLQGTAFLAIWHDIRADAEPDYNLWHTREHMPERLGIPGFLLGRRYVNWDLGLHRYFTLYEGAEAETFRSPAYLERLNNPTPWSLRVHPTMLNFIRCACQIVASQGLGFGGGLWTGRLRLAGEQKAAENNEARAALNAILELPGTCGAHYGAAAPEISGARTRETELRGNADRAGFDGVIMVETIGRREAGDLSAAIERIARALPGVSTCEAAVYELAYALRHIGPDRK